MVAHHAVDIHVFKRHFACEVCGHHNHARHPEEDDFVAGNKHIAGQKGFQIIGFRRPAQSGEGHECGGEPSVEHVFIAGECEAV